MLGNVRCILNGNVPSNGHGVLDKEAHSNFRLYSMVCHTTQRYATRISLIRTTETTDIIIILIQTEWFLILNFFVAVIHVLLRCHNSPYGVNCVRFWYKAWKSAEMMLYLPEALVFLHYCIFSYRCIVERYWINFSSKNIKLCDVIQATKRLPKAPHYEEQWVKPLALCGCSSITMIFF